MQHEFHSITPEQTHVRSLGATKIANPMMDDGKGFSGCVDEKRRMLMDPFPNDQAADLCLLLPEFELAGPRERIYFDPSKLKTAIVTCGGMCPGINSLVRAIVLQLHYIYGVKNVVGVRFGLQGFIPSYGHDLMELDPTSVLNVHGRGGSFLGMSRGAQPLEDIVDSLERLNIGLLFMIGGDSTLRAAKAITDEITKRALKIGVIAIPRPLTMTSASWRRPSASRPRWRRPHTPSWAPTTRPPARPTGSAW